jgi:Icc protein
VRALLQAFDDVTVVYGHVHQIQYNQIGNISFHAVMATAWPWPYPQSYAQAKSHLPKLTVPMNRADPFFERDATGWQLIDLDNGRVAMKYNLYNNTNRVVAYDAKKGEPVDKQFQEAANRIPPQTHY